jgi:AcrR family transcriptional regulator
LSTRLAGAAAVRPARDARSTASEARTSSAGGPSTPAAQLRRRRPRPPSGLAPRRRPRQQRAQATLEAILEAAAGLIARDGYPGLTTNKVAERAGVSIGSLYQYFPNKEAILVALLERHMSAIAPVIEESMRELADPKVPFPDAVRRLLLRLLDRHRDHPRLQRALTEEVPHPRHIRALQRQRDQEYTTRAAEIMRSRPDVHVRHVDAAAHVLVQTISALSRWLAHEPPDDVDRQACLEEVVRLLTAFAEADPAATARSAP